MPRKIDDHTSGVKQTRQTLQSTPAFVPELEWPADVAKLAQAVELLEAALAALDPDCYLDLCAEIERFIRG